MYKVMAPHESGVYANYGPLRKNLATAVAAADRKGGYVVNVATGERVYASEAYYSPASGQKSETKTEPESKLARRARLSAARVDRALAQLWAF